jgi:hypothetical protein
MYTNPVLTRYILTTQAVGAVVGVAHGYALSQTDKIQNLPTSVCQTIGWHGFNGILLGPWFPAVGLYWAVYYANPKCAILPRARVSAYGAGTPNQERKSA